MNLDRAEGQQEDGTRSFPSRGLQDAPSNTAHRQMGESILNVEDPPLYQHKNIGYNLGSNVFPIRKEVVGRRRSWLLEASVVKDG